MTKPRSTVTTKSATRPLLAEFSSIGVRRMMEWIEEHSPWSERMRDILFEHVQPVAERTGQEIEDVLDDLGEFFGPCLGAAFEDLCSRAYEEPPRNAVDDFLKKRGHRLPPLAKVYLEALRESTLRIYEVTAVRAGEGVSVRDQMVEGPPVDVIEVAGSQSLRQWDVIAARVLEYGGQRVFAGAVIPLKSDAAKSLRTDIQERLHRLAERTRPIDAERFRETATEALREAAPRIVALRVAEIVESRHRPLPELRNSDGDLIELIEVAYAFRKPDRKEVVSRLDTQEPLERCGKQPPAWLWLGPTISERRDAGKGARVSFAHLKLSGSRLVLTVNSHARLDKARGLIEPLLEGLVSAPEIVDYTEDLEADVAHDEPALPTEEEARLLREYLDRHYRAVMDQPVPMLGGRTPREAARDAAGRERLVELLKHYENSQARSQRGAMAAYDFGWMWRELGIEHLRK